MVEFELWNDDEQLDCGPAQLFQRCSAFAVLSMLFETDTHLMKQVGDVWVYEFYNGGGDELQIAFSAAGHVLVGFDHESDWSPYDDEPVRDAVYSQLPEALHDLVLKPEYLGPIQGDDAFSGQLGSKRVEEALRAVTFARWWSKGWAHGESEDDAFENGADWLIERAFEDYDMDFEAPEDAVEQVFAHVALTAELCEALEAEVELTDEQVKACGYGLSFPF